MSNHRFLTRFRSTSLLLFLSVSTSACAGMGTQAEGPRDGRVQVVVNNHSFSDLNIFLERDGHRHRLGFVMSQQTQTFSPGRRIIGGAAVYNLVADPVGSATKVISPMVEVHGVGTVHWLVEPTGFLSTVVYR